MNRFEAASIAVPESSSLPEENEEPPGKPRRHPKWNDVPDEQWDDWRWQMQNAIRTTSQLAEFFSYGPQEFAALESLEAEVQAGDSALLLLADQRRRSARSDRPAVASLVARAIEHRGRRAGRSAGRGQGLAGPGPDASLSGSGAAGHHARLHDVLPVLHAQARDHGPRRLGRSQPQRPADGPVRPRAPARFAT